MATPLTDTPKWFNAQFYLDQKLAKLLADDPKGNWTMASMKAAFAQAGFNNPFDHYLQNGDSDGLNPNAMFNGAEYLAAKAEQLGTTWTADMVAEAIHQNGLTLAQHYEQYGAKEGLNPSSKFDQNKYYEAKLDQLQTTDPKGEWTHEKMVAVFEASNITPLTHYLTFGKAEGLQDAKYDYSVGGKPIPHPGNTINLTTNVDVVTPESADAAFKTSSRDDVINGVVDASPSKATFNANDVIDGGEGNDVLKLTLNSGFTGLKDGSVKNVETVELFKAAGKSFSAKNFEGVQTYVVDGGETGNVTIKDVNSTATAYTLKQGKGNFAVQLADSAVAGKEDNVTVALNGVGDDKNTANISVKGTTASGKVEGITFDAIAKDNYVKTDQGHETITITGEGGINLGSVAAGLKTFNAADATGKVVANLTGATGNTLKAVTGGAGNDSITVGSLASTAVLDGGNGTDKLVLAINPTTGDRFNVTGFETVQFADGGLNGTNMSGVNEVVVAGAGANASITKFANTDMTLSLVQSTASVSYDGTGSLKIQDTDASNLGANTASKITADKVDTLSIVNADTGATSELFDIKILEAVNATSIAVDTGLGGVTLADAGTSKLGAVTSITATGDSTFTLGNASGGGFKALTEVNATELKGNFAFTMNEGIAAAATNKDGLVINGALTADNTVTGTAGNDYVKFYAGNGTNTFDGGAGVDKLELGDAAYKVDMGGYAALKNDHIAIKGFSNDDVFSGLSAVSTSATFNKGTSFATVNGTNDKYFVVTGEKANLDLNDITINGVSGTSATTNGIQKAVADAVGAVTTADLAKGIFVFDNGQDLGVYEVKVITNANNVGEAEVQAISLLGIIEGGIRADDLYAANFSA